MMGHRRTRRGLQLRQGALWHAWWPSRDEPPPTPGTSSSEEPVADSSVAWIDRGIAALAIATAFGAGLAKFPLPFLGAALCLILLRSEAHVAFVKRHRKTIRLIPAYALVVMASAASAILRAGLAFSIGLVLNGYV